MELLIEGLTISGIGVSFVISFLCLLILVMLITAKVLVIVGILFPEPKEAPAQPKKVVARDEDLIALAIAAAKRAK